MSSGHLTRKELQRDEVLEGARTGIEWVRQYRKPILQGVGAVVAVAIVAGSVLGFIGWRRQAAGTAVSEALAVMAETDRRDEGLALLEDAADRHGSAPAGEAASLVKVSRMVEKGEIESAWKALLEISRSGDPVVKAFAEYNLILIASAAGHGEDAVARVNQMLQNDRASLPKDVLLFSLAELHERLGQEEDAKTVYRRLVTEFPQSSLTSQARVRLGPDDPGLSLALTSN